MCTLSPQHSAAGQVLTGRGASGATMAMADPRSSHRTSIKSRPRTNVSHIAPPSHRAFSRALTGTAPPGPGRARLPPLPVPVEPPAYGTFCRELLDELTIALSTARSPLVSSSRVAVPRRRPAESRLRGIGKLELGRRRYLSVPGCGSSMSWTAVPVNPRTRRPYRGSRITIGIFRPFALRWKKSYPG